MRVKEKMEDKHQPVGCGLFNARKDRILVGQCVRGGWQDRHSGYLLNFFMTYVGSTALQIIKAFGGTPSFGVWCFNFIFNLWQGFWNAVIYVRPRYIRNREKNPDMSIWQAIMTEDEYDHRLGARAIRSTAGASNRMRGSFFGSMFRNSSQAQDTALQLLLVTKMA